MSDHEPDEDEPIIVFGSSTTRRELRETAERGKNASCWWPLLGGAIILGSGLAGIGMIGLAAG